MLAVEVVKPGAVVSTAATVMVLSNLQVGLETGGMAKRMLKKTSWQ
jgi:hypothetical protein